MQNISKWFSSKGSTGSKIHEKCCRKLHHKVPLKHIFWDMWYFYWWEKTDFDTTEDKCQITFYQMRHEHHVWYSDSSVFYCLERCLCVTHHGMNAVFSGKFEKKYVFHLCALIKTLGAPRARASILLIHKSNDFSTLMFLIKALRIVFPYLSFNCAHGRIELTPRWNKKDARYIALLNIE